MVVQQLRRYGAVLTSIATTAILVAPSMASALVGAHSYTNTGTGDVFLGGDYIELGISKYGSFGTTTGQALPSGFYGTAARNNIGMSSNAAGFGQTPDTRIDYFLPGTPEERWAVGYKISGTPTTASNAFLRGTTGISNYTVTNQSSGMLLKASGSGTLNSKLQIGQVVSFNAGDAFFKNEVTLTNISGAALDSVRYMRTFDPDNTVDKGGGSATKSQILFTQAAGDGKAVVVSDTSNNASDPVFLVNGSHSPILFYSKDTRARVSTFGFTNTDPYAASAYDSAAAKGTSVTADQAITITFDVGTLAAGASETVVYYTSLDNRDIDDVLQDIQNTESGDNDGVDTTTENAGPNNGDGNGDGTQDSQQTNVTSLPNTVVGGGTYETVQTTGCTTLTSVGVAAESHYGTDATYSYPLGMTNFNLTCAGAGDSAAITIFYDKQYNTSGWTARKYLNGSFKAVPGAVFGTAVVGGKTVTTLSYSVQDGGTLDADGAANGTIVDPAGPAVLAAATAPSTGVASANLWLPAISTIGGGTLLAYVASTKKAGKRAAR